MCLWDNQRCVSVRQAAVWDMISSSGSFEKSCSVMCYKNYLLLSFETSSSIVANVFVRPEAAWNGIVRQAEVYTIMCLWDKQHCIESVCETSSSLRPTAVHKIMFLWDK